MEGYGGAAPCDAGVVSGGGLHASESAARATTPTSERAEEAQSDRGARVRGAVLLAAALAVCGLAGWATTTGSSAAPRAAWLAAAHGRNRSKSMRSSGAFRRLRPDRRGGGGGGDAGRVGGCRRTRNTRRSEKTDHFHVTLEARASCELASWGASMAPSSSAAIRTPPGLRELGGGAQSFT